MYGTQAIGKPNVPTAWFENDVKMYGTQAFRIGKKYLNSLRMM